MRTASSLVRKVAYSLIELSGDLEKSEKEEGKPKFLFLATTYYPARPMAAIYETAEEAINGIKTRLGGGHDTLVVEENSYGYGFFHSTDNSKIATIKKKMIGSWNEWAPKVDDPELGLWRSLK